MVIASVHQRSPKHLPRRHQQTTSTIPASSSSLTHVHQLFPRGHLPWEGVANFIFPLRGVLYASSIVHHYRHRIKPPTINRPWKQSTISRILNIITTAMNDTTMVILNVVPHHLTDRCPYLNRYMRSCVVGDIPL